MGLLFTWVQELIFISTQKSQGLYIQLTETNKLMWAHKVPHSIHALFFFPTKMGSYTFTSVNAYWVFLLVPVTLTSFTARVSSIIQFSLLHFHLLSLHQFLVFILWNFKLLYKYTINNRLKTWAESQSRKSHEQGNTAWNITYSTMTTPSHVHSYRIQGTLLNCSCLFAMYANTWWSLCI